MSRDYNTANLLPSACVRSHIARLKSMSQGIGKRPQAEKEEADLDLDLDTEPAIFIRD